MSDLKKNQPTKVMRDPDQTALYKLALPIIYRGVDKVAGDEVELTDQQAERLRESGHIVSTGAN